MIRSIKKLINKIAPNKNAPNNPSYGLPQHPNN